MKFCDVHIDGISRSTRLAYERDIIRLQKLMGYKVPAGEFDIVAFARVDEPRCVMDKLSTCKYSPGTQKNIIRSLCKYLEACGENAEDYRTMMSSIDLVAPTNPETDLLRNINMILSYSAHHPAIRFAAHVLLTRDTRLLTLKLSDVISVSTDTTSTNYIDIDQGLWFVSGKCYPVTSDFCTKVADLLKTPLFVVGCTDLDTTLKQFNQTIKDTLNYSYVAAAQLLTPSVP